MLTILKSATLWYCVPNTHFPGRVPRPNNQLFNLKAPMKKTKKNKAGKKTLLGGANKSLKKFSKVTKRVGKLSTAQKVVGGAALLAAGITYLVRKQAKTSAVAGTSPDATGAEAALATLSEGGSEAGSEDPAPAAEGARKGRKGR
jgi:hypothetical protein